MRDWCQMHVVKWSKRNCCKWGGLMTWSLPCCIWIANGPVSRAPTSQSIWLEILDSMSSSKSLKMRLNARSVTKARSTMWCYARNRITLWVLLRTTRLWIRPSCWDSKIHLEQMQSTGTPWRINLMTLSRISRCVSKSQDCHPSSPFQGVKPIKSRKARTPQISWHL